MKKTARKTDKICQENFNGNMRETIEYILRHYKNEELTTFIKEWTDEELSVANQIIDEAPVVNQMDEHTQKSVDVNKEIEKILKKENANPYIKLVIKQLLFLVVADTILIFAAKYVVSAREILLGIITVLNGYMALSIGPNISNMFRWRKENKFK